MFKEEKKREGKERKGKGKRKGKVKEGPHQEAFPSLRQFYLHFNKKKGTCEKSLN